MGIVRMTSLVSLLSHGKTERTEKAQALNYNLGG